jgi:CBS domain-containing protein
MNGTTRITHTAPRDLTELRVADAMHDGVLTCRLEAPLRTVARMMAEHRVHCIVACDEDDDSPRTALWGVVSDLDLVGAANACDVDEWTAARAAATPVLSLARDETLERAAQLMTEHGVAHLVVVDPVHDRPLGVLSTLDVAAALAGLKREREEE